MANTTNFGWETPDDTDLVKDGAAAIRTLASAIDTSMADLEGGTTGQVLSKTSNTDMDFTWITSDDANAIQNAIVDAKGDIVAASAADTPARLAVGTNNQRLIAASGEATGLKYVSDTQNTVIDSAGDLLYGTAADTVARLGIGTAGQVLKVNSGATAPEWGTAGGGGGMTFLKKETFSGVSSVNINSVFSSTYLAYKIYWVIKENTDAQELLMRLRASGTDTTSNYNLSLLRTSGSDTLIVDDATITYIPVAFGQTTETVVGDMTLYAPNVADPTFYTFNMYTRYPSGGVIGGVQTSSTAFDGFTFYSPNTGGGNNFTGDILIYGLNLS